MDTDLLRAELEQYVNPLYRAYMLTEMSRGEALFEKTTNKSPYYGNRLQSLTKMYLEMNRQLGIVCRHLKYPSCQWEWKDSEPLTKLAKVYPGIQATKWYQRHLSMILNTSGQKL